MTVSPTAIGIRSEPMVTAHTVGNVSAVVGLRAMFAAPFVVIDPLVAYVKRFSLKGITWDMECSANHTDQVD